MRERTPQELDERVPGDLSHAAAPHGPPGGSHRRKESATPFVDVDAAKAPAFGLADDREPFDDPPHTHTRHQILLATRGVLHVETASGQWLLSPERAAWIPAGVEHRVRARVAIALRTVYLAPHLVPVTPAECRVFAVTPLARAMILRAVGWGPDQHDGDRVATPFFVAFAALTGEWMDPDERYRLPVAKSAELARAMTFTLDHMSEDIAVRDVARASGTSVRTLTRRFLDETGTTWRAFARTARMLRAMDLLSQPSARVGPTALAVGFNSLGAFASAFTQYTGESPLAYRRRCQARDDRAAS